MMLFSYSDFRGWHVVTNNTNQMQKTYWLSVSVLKVAFFLVLSGLSGAAYAAGLGKIVVFSALGQPLRAEIKVFATRDELSGMNAQLASPEVFKQAGLEYARTLSGIQFSLDKRSGGQSILRLSTDRPINDPFVAMLLDLNWSSGRLVREFTFLLDPPGIGINKVAPVTSATVAAPVSSSAFPAGKSPATSAIDDDIRTRALASVSVRESLHSPKDHQPKPGEAYKVRRGDTLRKIASETRREGASLEQMLVGLLRANQEAFDGGNMNRLKSGTVLAVPESSALESISAEEARKILIAQSSDWNAYRRNMASRVIQESTSEVAARQSATGKITARVEEDLAPATESRDKVSISRLQTTGSQTGTPARLGEEELIAKDKALRETNDRVASLEKNISSLQKLIELKNQNLAELQKQNETQTVSDAPINSRDAGSAPASHEPIPAIADRSAEAPSSPDAKFEAKPAARKPHNMQNPAPEPPSLLEDVLGSPWPIAGAVLLALFAGHLFYKRHQEIGVTSLQRQAPADMKRSRLRRR